MTGWRDVLKIHPAADVFPLLPEDELFALAEDIGKHGLRQKVVTWQDPATGEQWLLDGRNRLDALELERHEVIKNGRLSRAYDGGGSFAGDPTAYVISVNIRRRHLSKREQADLIVAAVKAAATDRAKPARSVKRAKSGRVAGTTKDPVKQKVVAIAKDQGISERTATQALVEAEPERKRSPVASPRQDGSATKEQKAKWKFIGGLDATVRALQTRTVEPILATCDEQEIAEIVCLAEEIERGIKRMFSSVEKKLAGPDVHPEQTTLIPDEPPKAKRSKRPEWA